MAQNKPLIEIRAYNDIVAAANSYKDHDIIIVISMIIVIPEKLVIIKRIHLLSACSLLSAEGFLFSTHAGVYKSMQFWPHPLIKSLC